MANNTEIVKDTRGKLGVNSQLALAPFDLGVTEGFEMRSIESEIPGVDEVTIKVRRKSGQPRDWARQNKVLLEELRKQFLIWRSLNHETMEMYRNATSECGL